MNYLQIFQKKNGLTADGVVGPNTLRKMKEVFSLTSNEATAHFVAQIAHETGMFKYGVESLNYSATALQRVFKKYFPTRSMALDYQRQPERIANLVYANRMGNGNVASGDGFRYRGRGGIQVTGKNNYKSFSEYTGCDFISNPDMVVGYYFETALWFFKYRNIWRHTSSVNSRSIRKVTRLINGGTNGLAHRQELTNKYYKLLK